MRWGAIQCDKLYFPKSMFRRSIIIYFQELVITFV